MSNQITASLLSSPRLVMPLQTQSAGLVVDEVPLVEEKSLSLSPLKAALQQLEAHRVQGKELDSKLKLMVGNGLQGKAVSAREAQQRDATKAERQLSLHLFNPQLSACQLVEQPDGSSLSHVLDAFTSASSVNARFASTPGSSWWINDSIADAIGGIGSGYLGVYENAVEKYIELYAEFSKMLDELSAGLTSDKETIILDAKKMKDIVDWLIYKIDGHVAGELPVLFPAPGEGPASKAEAEKWANEMGLGLGSVIEEGGGYVVVPDKGPLIEIQKLLKDGGKMKFTATEYQVWKAAFDSHDEKMKNTLQTMTQKYSNAQSLYDNLVKVLSSTISSLLETDKAFLQI